MQSLVFLSSPHNCLKFRSLSCIMCTHRAYSIVKPATLQPLRTVPKEIVRPPYIKSTFLSKIADNILHRMTKPDIKSKDDIARMKRSCQIAREVLNMVARSIQPGITTDELDRIAHEECIANGAYPSPLLYKGFPKSICTSVNNVACHGIPDNRCLQDGDIINVDVTVIVSYLPSFDYHSRCIPVCLLHYMISDMHIIITKFHFGIRASQILLK